MMAEPDRTDLQRRLLDRYGAGGVPLRALLRVRRNHGQRARGLFPQAATALPEPRLDGLYHLKQPLSEEAGPRNVVVGHLVAAVVGLAFLWGFGLLDAPSVLEGGTTLARVFAAALSVAVTEALLVLIAPSLTCLNPRLTPH